MSTTSEIRTWLIRLQDGDEGAPDELIRFAIQRLRQRAQEMLRRDRLRRYEMTDDLLQEAMIRLHKALKEVHPTSAEHFLGLAAQQIRRTLTDLARHHYGSYGQGKNRHTDGVPADEPGGSIEKKATQPEDLSDWTRFHEAVEALPEDLKNVMDLMWYGGLNQEEVAEVLGLSTRTIRRRWMQTQIKLASIPKPE